MSSGVAVTDVNGEARSTLTTSRETTVTATVGAKSGETTVSVDGALGLTVTVSPDPPMAGRPATFTIAVDRARPAAISCRSSQINFGDGESRTARRDLDRGHDDGCPHLRRRRNVHGHRDA